MSGMKKSFWFAGVLTLCTAIMAATLTTSLVAFSMSLSDTATNNADFYADLDNDGSYDLGCYITSNPSGNANGQVAIAWAGSKTATNNAELNLTKNYSFVHDGSNYDLTGVAYGGFRYTLFRRILLPNTVTDLGKESFAYCTNLSSFMLPHDVNVIPASCFLDCRKLETFTYYSGVVHHLYQYDEGNSSWVEFSSINTGEGVPEGDLDVTKPYLDTENKKVYRYAESSWGNGVSIQLSGEERPSQRTDITNPSGYYYRLEYRDSIVNDIASFAIEDHAFDSCVSLRSFIFPDNLSSIGESAFQKCTSLTKIYLPTENNNLIVKQYAFCDCSSLSWAYFERNVKDIGNYAFSNCHSSLIFHYGKKESGDVTKSIVDNKFINANLDLASASWRNKYLSTNRATNESDKIDFEINMVTHFRPSDHPEIIFSVESGNIYLNCQTGNREPICLDDSGGSYVAIQQWTPPKDSTVGYYDAEKGELEIPGLVTVGESTLTVKVIGEEAFKDQTCLTKVKLNDGLVQIQKRAFYRCPNIYSFDMSDLTTLKEISNSVFNDLLSKTTNSDDRAKSLDIPPSVEYIGSYAFYGFTKVDSLEFNHEESNLKVLGGYSFARIGESYNEGKIDLILPCTLDDSAAKRAQINVQTTANGKPDYCLENWAAIGPYAFGCGQDAHGGTHSAIRSVTIDTCDHEHSPMLGTDAFSTSLAPNAFARSKFLIRFAANQNLLYIGVDSFKDCLNLKELFLTTSRAESSGKDYPWGTRDEGDNYDVNGIFSGDSAPKDLVIYLDNGSLDEKRAPGKMDDKPWYSENANTYTHEADGSFGRSSIPVIDNVAFGASKTAVLYWLPNDSGGSFLSEPPTQESQYNGTATGCSNGVIVLAQTGTYGESGKEYTVVKYFYDPNQDVPLSEIDLTSISTTVSYTVTENESTVTKAYWNESNHITEIGEEAFANDAGKHRGLYFILPNTVTTISERAFYRNSVESGARIIAYKDAEGTHGDYEDAKEDPSKYYCDLPTTIIRIERNAFYGNQFVTAKINSNLQFFGKSAFYSSDSQLATASITYASSTYFEHSNNGIYYVGESKKALLYQAQNIGGTLDLSGDSALKAIGMNAVSKTSYSTISLPTSLTHIYGGGFQNNASLTQVTIPSGSNLKYISAYTPNDGYWDAENLPFDIIDYSNKADEETKLINSQGRAFKGCANLSTLNFKNLTQLAKIGNDAFSGCASLKNMVGESASYKYYKNGTLSSETPAGNAGVLDLSHLNGSSSNAQLLSIGANAFAGCDGIQYIHLPASSASGDLVVAGNSGVSESAGQIISDNKGINVLVGDKARKACSTASGLSNIEEIIKCYNTTCFGSGNNIYYYAEGRSDLLTGTNSAIKYWTKNGVTDGYVLLDDYDRAFAYLR